MAVLILWLKTTHAGGGERGNGDTISSPAPLFPMCSPAAVFPPLQALSAMLWG